MEIINHKGTYYLKTETGYREVLATTDESLKIDNDITNQTSAIWDKTNIKRVIVGSKSLPKPSDSFISKYIEEYNKGQKIENILVEYEKVYPKHFTYNPSENMFINLKVDSNNTITIKKVKDSYSREEVIEILSKMRNYCKDGWKSDSLHRVFYDYNNWIKENL